MLLEDINSNCPWQASHSYFARKMDPNRIAEEGSGVGGGSGGGDESSGGKNGSIPASGTGIEKSLLDLMQRYPVKEDGNVSGGRCVVNDGGGGGGRSSSRGRVECVGSENDSPNFNQKQHLLRKFQANKQISEKRKSGHGLCLFYWILVTFISGLIAFSLWLSVQISIRNNMMNSRGAQNKELFSFNDIFNSSLQPRSFSVDWVPGADAFTFIDDYGDLVLYNITSNNTQVLLSDDILGDFSDYWVSADLNYVLLATDIRTLWRHSFYATYAIYDVIDEDVIGFPADVLEGRELQYAGWAPRGMGLAFVVGNNLYYQDTPYDTPVQLTTTGVEKVLFNGVPDWLYEEELLASHYAIWWSPDARYITYGVFNCTNVPFFKFPYYGPKSDVYGDVIEIAYPKSGDITPGRNTIAQLKIVDTQDNDAAHKNIPPPDDLQNQDHYFLQVSWRNSSSIGIAWANRVQNRTIHTICDIQTAVQCIDNYDREVSGGWIEILPDMWFVEGGSSYLTVLPEGVPTFGTWKNLASITAPLDDEGDVTMLTEYSREVQYVAGVDPETNDVFYVSTDENPGNRHLYQTNLGGTDPTCLSCDVLNCTYVSVSFSDTGKYYVLGCRGPTIPRYMLKHTMSNWELMLEDNADVAANLATKDLPRVHIQKIPIGGGNEDVISAMIERCERVADIISERMDKDNITNTPIVITFLLHDQFLEKKILLAYAKLLIPSIVDTDPEWQSPLMIETYGGPGSQAVNSVFSTGYETYLASTHNVVYAFMDGRGTVGRGEEFKHLLYRKMATIEVEDQLIGTEWMLKNLRFVDMDQNVAIQGWSYGGFLTSHALANESNVFQCGISGAALIDRRFYDTAHSERYMGFATPEDNQEGYERTDITKKISNFREKNLLLVHGTADDNVHFASTAQFAKALTEENIQFRFQLYTDQNHYFSSRSRHLYHLYDNFLLNDCWQDSVAKAKLKRENRVMEKNLKLHGVPEPSKRNKYKNT